MNRQRIKKCATSSGGYFFASSAFEHFGKAPGDFASNLGGSSGRIERLRFEPDRSQTLTCLGLAQVFQINAKALSVWELRVVLSLSGEISINLDAVADIANENEGRPAVRGRQRAGVLFRLTLGVEHEHIPGAARAGPAAFRRIGFAENRSFWPAIALSPLPAALLGFENERILAVKIDPADRVAVIAVTRHYALEDVIVPLMTGAGGIGMRQPQRIAKLGEEQRVIGALLSALLALPARYKGRCPLRMRVSQADNPTHD